MTKAITKLQNSKLLDQNQLMLTDVDLSSLNLALKGSASMRIVEAVTDAEVTRTIEGASTVVVTVFDRDREILRSGRLAKGTDIKIDGLWFRLAGVDKVGDYLTLTFEDREVALLRTYKKPITMARKKISRARFIKRMVDEVKEVKISFVCPEIDKIIPTAPIAAGGAPFDPQSHGETIYVRGPGLAPFADITVRGIPASPLQTEMTDRVLRVGANRNASFNVLVAAIEVINEESGAMNLSGGDLDSAGLFQQRPAAGWGTHAQVTNPEYAANKFFDRAIAAYGGNPGMQPEYIAMEAQVAGNQESRIIPIWRKYREEAVRTVTKWGVQKGTTDTQRPAIEDARPALKENTQQVSDDQLLKDFQAQQAAQGAALALNSANYQFSRGIQTIKDGQKKWKIESSWVCSGRLADEIGWRRFVVSGTFYLMSEPYLFRSKPVARLTEDTPGVISIDGSYLTYTKNATLTIKCHINRWEAPPGSMIEITQCGLLSGRWLVTEINRNLFTTEATITCKKPRPVLPEPNLDQEKSLTYSLDEIPGGVGDPGTNLSTIISGGDPSAFPGINQAGDLETLRALITKGAVTFDSHPPLGDNDRAGLMLAGAIKRSDGTLVPIDPKVVAFLAWAGTSFGPIRAGSVVGTHDQYVAGSNPPKESRHWTGHAVDIGSISNNRVDNQSSRAAVIAFMTAVNNLSSGIRPNQMICNGAGREDAEIQALQLNDQSPKGGHWVDGHINHVHIGY